MAGSSAKRAENETLSEKAQSSGSENVEIQPTTVTQQLCMSTSTAFQLSNLKATSVSGLLVVQGLVSRGCVHNCWIITQQRLNKAGVIIEVCFLFS